MPRKRIIPKKDVQRRTIAAKSKTGRQTRFNLKVTKPMKGKALRLIATIGNQIVGSQLIVKKPNKHAVFANFSVHGDFQEKGIGSRIAKEALRQCKKEGIKTVETQPTKQSLGIAKKLGFKWTNKKLNKMGLTIKKHKKKKAR